MRRLKSGLAQHRPRRVSRNQTSFALEKQMLEVIKLLKQLTKVVQGSFLKEYQDQSQALPHWILTRLPSSGSRRHLKPATSDKEGAK